MRKTAKGLEAHPPARDLGPILPEIPHTPAPTRAADLAGAPGSEWLIWQLADSAFPAGSFAHSNGLEAAWQQGEIRSSDELEQYARAYLEQTGRSAVPFMNEAYCQRRPFAGIDRACDAFLSNHVANRGSRAQGQAFLLAASQSFRDASLTLFRAEVLGQKLPSHMAPTFGNVLRLLKVTHGLAVRLFLFLNVRSVLAGAVRLGIVGPMAAQAIQAGLSQATERVAGACSGFCLADASQVAPVLDLWHGTHDRLYSRLFQT